MNVARTVQEIEEAGLAGCHIEDQINPKRCGHLDNKTLVDTETMVKRIRAAAQAKRDPNFLLIARTDARAPEGFGIRHHPRQSLHRRRRGDDLPQGPADEREFELFRKAVSVPLLANMTEFGKSKILSADQLQSLGYNIVIYPVTTLRLAMKAVEDGLKQSLPTARSKIF